MRKLLTKQGLFQRTILALLALTFVAIPAAAHAISFDELAAQERQMSTNDITEQLGLSDSTACQLNPSNPGEITKESAKKLSVEAGGITFTFDHAYYRNRSGGAESMDFIFTPSQGDKRLVQPAFVYRTGERATSNAFLIGVDAAGVPMDGGDGYELDSNQVAGRCANFNDSAFAKSLDEVATEDNLDMLNVAGRDQLSSDTNALTNGSDTDPFTMAVQKITEVLVSLNHSMVSALTTVMDLGNITEVKGLTSAWMTVRDLINLLFVVVLAALSVLTILRIDARSYDVRKSLPLLVFAVIGVNFALLMATIMVNTAFVLAQPFMNKATAIVESTALNNPAANSAGADFGTSVVMLFAALIMLIGLGILLFFFVIRIIVVWILAALSPVIFLFLVLPITRGESLNLLQTWIKWVYMAPIAFLILYIGSAMLLPAFGSGASGDSGASAILSAIFYAGVLAAAVLIPYGLGGSIMGRVGSKGFGVVGTGAKGGLAGAALLPTGGGRTLGQRVRTGKAFLKGREDSLEQDAAYDAANLRLRAASMGGVGAGVAGLSDGQQIAIQEQMVQARDKEMVPLDTSAKMRVAHAWQYGTLTEGGQVYARGADGKKYGKLAMTDKEQALSKDRFAAAAAYKTLASGDISEPYMVERPGVGGRTFAWTGYQQQHRGNPMIAAYDLNGRFNEGKMKVIAQTMPGDDLKGLDTEVFQNGGRAPLGSEEQRRSIEFFRNVDAGRLARGADADHRDRFSTAVKQNEMARIAKNGMLSRGLAGDEARVQREKERLIMKAWESGQNKLGRTQAEMDDLLK